MYIDNMWRCHVPFILLPNKTITYIQSKPSQTAEKDDSLKTILLPYTDQYITDHKTQINYKTASSLATYMGCVESHQVQKKTGQQICKACIIKDLSIPLRSSLFCQSVCTKICFLSDASYIHLPCSSQERPAIQNNNRYSMKMQRDYF